MTQWFETAQAQTLLAALHDLTAISERIEQAFGQTIPDADPVCAIGKLEWKPVHEGLSHDWRPKFRVTGSGACEAVWSALEDLRGDDDVSVDRAIGLWRQSQRGMAA